MPEVATSPVSRELIEQLSAGEPEYVAQARLSAFAQYESVPFPTESTQGWRRTDLAGISLTPAAPLPSECEIEVSPQDARAGIVARSLESAVRQNGAATNALTSIVSEVNTGLSIRKFSALAQSLWQGGGYVFVPDNVQASKPITVSWRNGPYPRLIVILGKSASATIVEQHTDAPAFSAGKSDIVVGDGAHLKYLHVQAAPRDAVVFSHQRAQIGRDAKLVTLNVGTGGRLARTDLEVELQGAGAESDMLGLVFGEQRQQFDYHTLQGHRAPHTRSDLLFKAALDDKSHSAYTGVIIIDRGAQRSDAYQANRNLLLAEGARADTEPMLEIEADDVRCTHGATVGPVDEEQLFYATTRGLAPDVAARLIVEGFFREVLEKFGEASVTESLRDRFATHLERVGIQ